METTKKIAYNVFVLPITTFLAPVVKLKKLLLPPKPKHILLLGPCGSGKTTLLYRLKIPGWKFQDMQKEALYSKDPDERRELDPAYHYEEFYGENLAYAIWDLPGDPSWCRMWSTFYRFMTVTAIVFLVDGTEEDPVAIENAKAQLRQLLGEDELRDAAFCVIVNDKKEERKDGSEKKYNRAEDFWKYELGIANDAGASTIHRSMESNLRYFIFDVKELKKGDASPDWVQVIEHIKKVQITKGPS